MKNGLLAFFLLFAFAASAQLETLKNAAKSKLESQDFNSQRSNKERNMLNNKKRSAPANAVPPPPPAPGASAPEEADSTAAPASDAPVVSGTPVSGSSYTFDKRITYEMTDPTNPDKESTTQTYYYGENAMMSVMSEQEMAVIYDFGGETMTTVNEKDRTATVMSARWIGRAAEKQAVSDDVTVTKTGRTKTILGYTCEEYEIRDPKSRIVCWVTTEIAMDYTKFLRVTGKNVSKAYTENFEGQGVSMEITIYDKKDRPESHMIMTEYREETLVKDLAGYEVTSLMMR